MTICPCYFEQGTKTRTVTVLGSASLPSFYEVEDERGNQYTVHRDQLMLPPVIPARFKQHLFKEFAPVIALALNAYPGIIRVDPSPLSLATYRARFKDAITAKKRFGWEWVGLDNKSFHAHADELSCALVDTVLWIGPMDSIKTARTQHIEPIVKPIEDEPTYTVTHDARTLEHLCWLLSNKRIMPTPRFVVDSPDPAIVEDLEARYDVSFMQFEGIKTRYEIR